VEHLCNYWGKFRLLLLCGYCSI